MKVIYIADDGKEFDNAYDCESYEWKLDHTHLNEICFYDKDGNKLDDAYSENTYNNAERIVVPNENAVKELQELGRYTGYCCYEDIVECGEWQFNYKKETFVKS